MDSEPKSPGWSVSGYSDGKPTDNLEEDVIVSSARSKQGQGLVFLCSAASGLQVVIAYEPEDDLLEQVSKTQNFLRVKKGTMTISQKDEETKWLWKKRHKTLQISEKSATFKLLNAVFRERQITLTLDGMKEMKLDFPAVDKSMDDFVNNCAVTKKKA